MSNEKKDQNIPMYQDPVTRIKNLNTIQSIVTGATAAVSETAFLGHLFWKIKTRYQKKEPFTLKPGVLYTGIVPNVLSMMPITITQITLNNILQNIYSSDSHTPTTSQKMTCAFVAGIGSSIISCPMEFIMTHQGQPYAHKTFIGTARYLINQYSWKSIFAGLPATAIKEGIFSTCYLALIPTIKAQIYPSIVPNDYAASLTAGISSGLIATALSHYFDCIKTQQQSENLAKSDTVLTATKTLYQEKGFAGFFKGIVPRGLRVMYAVTIMGFIDEQFRNYYLHDQKEETKIGLTIQQLMTLMNWTQNKFNDLFQQDVNQESHDDSKTNGPSNN